MLSCPDMGTVEVTQDLATNTATLGGQSLVFHCHFYNCALQAAIEDALGDEAALVQSRSAEEVVRAQLTQLVVGLEPKARVELGASLFAQLGFGVLDLSGLSARGGSVVVHGSHYAMGWVAIYGERSTPVCNFVEGFVAAVFGVAFGVAVAHVRVREKRCFACGADHCALDVEVV